jgi:23S rRNA (uracil1939-C5)-methyltransferase
MSNKKYNISVSGSKSTPDIGGGAKNRPVSPGASELSIDRLAAGGRGVARLDGKVWFIPGTIPGDIVRARVLREHKRFVEGRVVEMLTPSSARREPFCPHQDRCGGCPWMVLEEDDQRRWKRSVIQDALSRIADLKTLKIEEMLTGTVLQGYRNKAEFTIGLDGAGHPAIGFIGGSEGMELVDIDNCPVIHDTANALFSSVREYLLDEANDLKSVFDKPDRLRCVIRRSATSGELLVALREVQPDFPRIERLAEFLMERHPLLVGVVHLHAVAGQRGGVQEEVICGQGWISEHIEGLDLKLRAASFFQINTEMATELTRLVGQLAGPVDGVRVFDLYGGIGTFGLSLATKGARVVVCEADPMAVASGRECASRSGIQKVKFDRSRVRRFLVERLAARDRPGLVVANPPRSGLDKGVVEAIVALQPERVILVSCDPATLARDLRRFVAGGWQPVRVIPVDLFPQTAHVESVVLLRAKGRHRPQRADSRR